MVEVNLNCESDIRPENFIIENILNGKCDIVINDDIKEIENTILGDAEKETKYIFNSYRITTNYRDGLENELKDDEMFGQWLSVLKKQYYNEKAQEIRNIRDELLRESDAEMCLDRMGLEIPTGSTFTSWLAFLKRLGNAISGNMAKYRQELRDITKQESFPFNVVFPTKPTKED